MTDEHECEAFVAGLEAWLDGTASAEAARRAAAHAAACPDCGALAALERRLGAVTTERLEQDAPEALVSGLWERLEPLLPARTTPERTRPAAPAPAPRPPRVPWFARPALAWAAVLVLVAGNALLLREVLSLRALAGRLTTTGALAGGPAPGGAGPAADAGLPRGWQQMTLGEARVRLDRLPSGALLVAPAVAARWLDELSPDERRAARRWLRAVDLADGLQAGEARRLLDAVPAPPEATLRGLLPAERRDGSGRV